MRKILSVMLAVMMVLSTVSFAAPSAFSVIDAAFAFPVIPDVDEEAAPAELAEAADPSTFGTLVWNLDFEDNTYPTFFPSANTSYISECGGVYQYTSANNEFEVPSAFDGAYYRIEMPLNTANSAYDTSKNGTNALVIKGVNMRYPYFAINAKKSSDSWDNVGFPNGYYTIMVDLAVDASNVKKGVTIPRIGNGGGKTSGHEQSLTTDMTTFTQTFVISDGTNSGQKFWSYEGGNVTDDLSIVNNIGIYFGEHEFYDVMYLDNFKVYWKPLEVKVEFVSGSTVIATKNVSTKGLTFDELSVALGLSEEFTINSLYIGDTLYLPGDMIYLEEDCTIDVEYGPVSSDYVDPMKGFKLFNIDFENLDLGRVIDKDPNYADEVVYLSESYKTPLADRFMTKDITKWYMISTSGEAGVIATDPKNPSNKVLAVINIDNSGYPMFEVNSWASYGTQKAWGFVDDIEGVYTVEYDFMATNDTLGLTERIGGRSSINGWENKQDVPKRVEPAKVANEYRTVQAIYGPEKTYPNDPGSLLGSTKEVSFFKLHTCEPKGGVSYYRDNVSLWWKPSKADVKIDANGYAASIDKAVLSDVATSGLKVSDLIALAGVDTSGVDALLYSFKGISKDPAGTVTYGLDDALPLITDTTFYLIFEENDLSEWTQYPEKGILVADINFDSYPEYTQYYYLNNHEKLNPAFKNYDKWYMEASYMKDVTFNGEFAGTLKEKLQYPQVGIIAYHNTLNPGGTFAGPGYYYVEADMYVPSGADVGSIGIIPHKMINGVSTQSTGIKQLFNDDIPLNQYVTLGGKLDATDCEGLSRVILLYSRTSGSVTSEPQVKFDNVRIYWKPETVNLTIHGGSNKNFKKIVLNDIPTNTPIEELIEMLPGNLDGYGKITGLANMEGEKLTSLNLLTDTALIAAWTPWNVIEGYGQEFTETHKGGGASTYSIGGYGNKDDVGDGGGDLSSAISWMYNNGFYTEAGNFHKVHKAVMKGDIAKDGHVEPYNVYGTNSRTQNGLIRTNIFMNIPVNADMEGVLVKYRVKNIPDFSKYDDITVSEDGYTATFKNRIGEDVEFTVKPQYMNKYYFHTRSGNYAYAGGYEDPANAYRLMVEGEWVYDYIPVGSQTQIVEEGVDYILLQNWNMWDGLEVEYDYFRVVGAGVEEDEVTIPVSPSEPIRLKAPTSLESETSLRYAAEDEDLEKYGESRNGIRFKAAVTAKDKKNATHIGWLIVSEANFVDAGYTYSELKIEALEAEDVYVKAAYQKLEGTDKANFFDTEDDKANVFSAVLYGIPEEHYTSYILIRPFVSDGNKYYYGEPFAACMYDLAAEIYYGEMFDELEEDMQYYIEDLVWYCEDNLLG